MRFKVLSHLLSYFLFIFAIVLSIPLCVSIYFDFIVDKSIHPFPSSFSAFLFTIIITLCLASIFKIIGRHSQKRFFRRESLLMVFFVWIFISVLGAIPFYATQTIESPIDALFESVSGFTTTGSSIILPKKYDPKTGQEIDYVKKIPQTGKSFTYKGTIKDLTNPFTGKTLSGFEAIPRPILFWRSFIQWLGGIGVVFVFIAFFPGLALGGKLLYEAESHPVTDQGSAHEALKPRVKESSSYLWKIYLCMTVFEIILLYFTNPDMKLFDSVCISFSTLSTGGFAVHSQGMAYYTSPITQWIVIAFMLLGAINFGLYFQIIKGQFRKIFNVELLLFWVLVVLSSGLVIWQLSNALPTLETIRAGCFQTVSSMTCTGFYTKDYDFWPLSCQAIMIMVMFVGGMTGSTSGGIKTSRHIILFRSFKKQLELLYRPNLIKQVKIGKSSVEHNPGATNNVYVFFWIIVIVSSIASTIYIFNGLDIETAIGLTACSINNVGLAFRMAGPGNTCAFLPLFSKILTIILMLIGRLEFFVFFIIFTKSFWKTT